MQRKAMCEELHIENHKLQERKKKQGQQTVGNYTQTKTGLC